MRVFPAAAALIAIACSPASAQRTTYNGVADCTRTAAVQLKRQDKNFRRLVIDRPSLVEDRYGAMVGNQYVPTIYSGSATYESGSASRKVMFVCLHSGTGRGAVLVYALPHLAAP